MIGEGTLHMVNGRQVSEKEWADYREAQGWKRGYNSAIVDVKGALAKLDQMTSDAEFRQKVREFTDDLHSV